MGDTTCLRCAAHEAAVPTKEQLRFVLGDQKLGDGAYTPRAITPDQAYAAQALASALEIFVDAFGIQNAAARMNLAVQALQRSRRYQALVKQTVEVRGG